MKIHFLCLFLFISLSLFGTYNTTVNNFLIKNINCRYSFDIISLKHCYCYDSLKDENRYLLEELLKIKNQYINNIDHSDISPDIKSQYYLVDAHVIKNNFLLHENFMIIDVGKNQDIEEGMCVITNKGFVGKIVAVFENYAKVISLLHDKFQIAVKILPSNIVGTIKWTYSDNFNTTKLLNIIDKSLININDEIVTAGYSVDIFPNLKIGNIVDIKSNHNKVFCDITVKLSNNFAALNKVYVIKNKKNNEKISII